MCMGVWATCEWRIHAHAAPVGGGIGTDVIVGDLTGPTRWGTFGGETAFSLGTTSCNIGDQPLVWIANGTNHPVITQSLYRVKDGRIEQLGQSWLKHGFTALQQNLCGGCQPNPNGSALGVGCSDPYGATLNGSQGGLGPKSEVNATTGGFAWPYRSLLSNNDPENVLRGRLVVANDAINPAMNAGASYYTESQYIHPEDAAAGNDDNNASYRRVTTSGSGSNFNMSFSGPTVRQEPAINAWKVVHPDVELYEVDIPDDGRVIVGVRTTPNGGGGFHTEVAVYNLNSHQSVRSMSMDFCSGSVSSPGFNDVSYHDEPYDETDWASSVTGSEMEWSTETFAQNQNANALRWCCLYSFWCDSDNEPAEITLGLFRPGTVSEMTIDLGGCPTVLLGDANQDGLVNLLDVGPFVDLLGNGGFLAEVDMNGDGVFNLLDVRGFIDALAGN